MTEEESFMSGSTFDLFEFGKEFPMGQFPRKVKIAVVDGNGPKPDVRFVVTVAKNRGFTMELFTDADDARRWLQE